jgi:predicted dehydrogenase
MSPIRVGICGAGFIAQVHSHGYAANPELATVTRVVDPRLEHAERLAARHGATASVDFADLLDADVDAISLCTPTPTHGELAVAALRAGKHVLCEKPIARTIAEAEAMIAAAEETGNTLMIAHVVRYEEDHKRAHDLLASGEIGELRMASQSITGPFPDWSAGGWFADAAQSGGPVLDLGIHSFDFLNWVFNSPVVRVTAVGARHKIALPSHALVTLRFENGGIAQVEASWSHPRGQGLLARTELMGTQGRIAWDYDSITPVQVIRDERRNHIFTGEVWSAEVVDFLRSVRDDTPSPIPGAVGLEALRVGLAAIESLETGRTVEVQPAAVSASS